MVVFALLGTLACLSDLLMEGLPNIHLLGTLFALCTLVYRAKALLPIYVYVLIQGLLLGFSMWWVPYLYVWTVLWGITMLLPRRMPRAVACVVYPTVCALHGFLFGILYSPAQAWMFGFSFQQTLAWIAAGLPFDLLHGIGNLFAGLMVYPLSVLLRRLMGYPPLSKNA